MKKLFLLSLLIMPFFGKAQNVGINTTTPEATLDVRGSLRTGGINNYVRYDSATGKIEWFGASLFTPTSQQIIKHSASAEGLYAGGGKLDYRNQSGDPVFYSDWTNGNGYFAGRLGIGNLAPQFPLSFNGSLGDKISLWTDGTTTHYGFGIQSGLFQMFGKSVSDDIAFGYGSSSSFTEAMRIKGNGNVGIGTATPNAPLSFPPVLGKKITLYPGSTGDVGMGVSGNRLLIYADNPNADVAFGYDAAGTFNERFAVKPNGALAVNGNTGNAGQVLQSNGNGAAATWVSGTNQLFNNVYTFGLSSYVLTTGNGVVYELPGLNQNITLAQTSKLLISIHAAGYNNGCFACDQAVMEFELFIDNGTNYFQYKNAYTPNGSSFDEDSGLRAITLGPGTHNFKMVAQHNAGGNINIYPDSQPFGTRMIIVVIPQ